MPTLRAGARNAGDVVVGGTGAINQRWMTFHNLYFILFHMNIKTFIIITIIGQTIGFFVPKFWSFVIKFITNKHKSSDIAEPKNISAKKRSIFWIIYGLFFLTASASVLSFLLFNPKVIITKLTIFGISIFTMYTYLLILSVFDDIFPKK
jgi:hypothetical protein